MRSQEVVRQKFGLEIGPALMGNSYGSLFGVGAELYFVDGGTPNVLPCVAELEEFQRWGEYRPFENPTARRILHMWRTAQDRLGVKLGIPFGNEAPFTAAVLLRGQEFYVDVMERPALAEAFLQRLTDNWLTCRWALAELSGDRPESVPVGLADDFSGLLGPEQYRRFVLPVYARIFEQTKATRRSLHSELLRPEHLPLLAEVGIDHFDPHVDQYLTAADLRDRLPASTEWTWRVVTSHMNICGAEQVMAEYEEGVRAGAPAIKVVIMPEVPEENIHAILEVGRKHAPEQ
jgi:hypothetical protein